MSRARTCLYPASVLSISLLTACATAGGPASISAEDQLEAAYAEQLAPATAAEIAEIERADALVRANFWAAEFRKDPQSLSTTISFTSVLREIGSHDRAIDVLTKTIPMHPRSHDLQLIMGRALLSENRSGEAAEAFYQASVIAPDNAAAHAGLGLSMDRLERHHDAQNSYRTALEIDPGRISTLTNYGLSLALSGDLDAAEAKLRTASADPQAGAQVRQNLALVLGLQGRFEEMRAVDPHAPKRTVEANLTSIKTMLAPTRDYGALRNEADSAQPAVEEQTPAPSAPSVPQLRGSLSP
jgi:Flp pilus assembly protein TadD